MRASSPSASRVGSVCCTSTCHNNVTHIHVSGRTSHDNTFIRRYLHNAHTCAIHYGCPLHETQLVPALHDPLHLTTEGTLPTAAVVLHYLSQSRLTWRRAGKKTVTAKFKRGSDQSASHPQPEVLRILKADPGSRRDEKTGENTQSSEHSPHVGAGRSSATQVRARVRDGGESDLTSGNPGTAPVSNVDAAVWLHDRVKRKREEDKAVHQTAPQFEWAAGEPPRRCRTRLERSLHGGPTARRDADEAGRQRWLQVLADLVRHSSTPMGQLLAAQPGNVEVLGAGKRASTLRSRVRAIRKFLRWLRVTRQLDHAQSVEHYTEYLRTRLSETCNSSTEDTASRTSFPGRIDLYSAPGPANIDKTLLGCIPRAACHGVARETKQAGSKNVCVDVTSVGKGRDGHGACSPSYACTLGGCWSESRVIEASISLWLLCGTLLVKDDWSREVSRVPPADNRTLLLPVIAGMDAHWVHSPSAARAVPARLSAPIAGVQLDRSAHR